MEKLSKVSKITFDKTGTLTYGTPTVTAVKSVSDYSEDEIYDFAAAAEQMSEHPLGKAIVKCYGKKPKECSDFKMIPGEGVTALVDGKGIRAGNLKLLKETCLSKTLAENAGKYINQGNTVIYIAVENTLAGFLVLSDTLREESKQMIQSLKEAGVEPVLLTGDHQKTADSIAEALNIQKVYANCRPEDKLRCIDAYQKNGNSVCMIGDGINDAPALKKANIGIGMGGIGSDIAVEAADIALVDDEIKELPHLPALSKRMMTTIKLNLTFSMGLNFLAIILAITGILGPVIGTLVHNAGSVVVILNSALLLKWQQK